MASPSSPSLYPKVHILFRTCSATNFPFPVLRPLAKEENTFKNQRNGGGTREASGGPLRLTSHSLGGRVEDEAAGAILCPQKQEFAKEFSWFFRRVRVLCEAFADSRIPKDILLMNSNFIASLLLPLFLFRSLLPPSSSFSPRGFSDTNRAKVSASKVGGRRK